MSEAKDTPASLREFCRGRWADACSFHPHTAGELLKLLVKRIEARDDRALVLFDLDSTLFDVSPRHWRILQEWAAQQAPDSAAGRSGLAIALQSARPEALGYSVEDTLQAIGVDVRHPETRPALTELKRFWGQRFFTHEYLAHDAVTPGALAFVKRVERAGARIVYLTGRDEPGMGEGTRQVLKQEGFPLDGERAQLWLKPRFEMDDASFKRDAAARLRSLGELVASFENEPKNLVMLKSEFPDALHVWLETVASEHPAPPVRGIYRLRDFQA